MSTIKINVRESSPFVTIHELDAGDFFMLERDNLLRMVMPYAQYIIIGEKPMKLYSGHYHSKTLRPVTVNEINASF